VAAGARLGEPAVWVGSAALAAPLSTSVLGSPATATPVHQRCVGAVLMVLGSLPRAIEVQLSALRSVLRVVPVEVDTLALALAHGGARAGRAIDDAATAVVRALRVGADTALFAGGWAPTQGGLSARIAAGLAGVARRALCEARGGRLVVTGGHTARAVCDALWRSAARWAPGSTWSPRPGPSAIGSRSYARSSTTPRDRRLID
jgi:uncharacterized protein YgbK (DUF1537 family)